MHGITLLELPLDILVKIFGILNESDLSKLMRTCKTLNNLIVHDNTIWRNVARNKLIINDRLPRLSNPERWFNRCRISYNWRNGVFREQSKFHCGILYIPWLQLYKSQMLLSLGSDMFCYSTGRDGSPNCRTYLWSLRVPIVQRYDIRTNDVSRFVIKDNVLFCGNRDGSACAFLLNSNTKPTLLCHIYNCHHNGQVEVTAVEGIKTGSNLCMLSGSCKSSELSMFTWNCTEDGYEHIKNAMRKNYSTQTIKIPSNEVGVKCLAANEANDKIAIGLAGNTRPLLLDCQRCEFQLPIDTNLNMKRDAIRDITWHNENTMAYVSHSGTLQLLDIRAKPVIHDSMDPFHSSLYCLKTDGNNALVAGASEYSRCVLFDIRRPGVHVQMYYTQKNCSPVYSLDFNSKQLFAAVDRSLALLDFDVNSSVTRMCNYSDVFEVVRR